MKKHIPTVLSVLMLGLLVLFSAHLTDAKGGGHGNAGSNGNGGGSAAGQIVSPDGGSTGPKVISRCGTTVRSPGTYILSGDLNCSSGHGIDFSAKAVGSTLDCNGYSIVGQGTIMKRGSYVTAIGIYLMSGADNIRIQNCHISNFSSMGILVNAWYAEIDSVFANNAGTGIVLNGSHALLQNDDLYGNLNGLQMANGSFDNTVTNITLNTNTNYGIVMAQTSNDLVSGSATGNATGIFMGATATAVTIQDFTSNGNTYDGIYLTGVSGNTLDHVTTYGNGRYGVYFNGASDNTLVNSLSYNNVSTDVYTDSLMNGSTGSNTCRPHSCYENSSSSLGLCASFDSGSGVGSCQIDYDPGP